MELLKRWDKHFQEMLIAKNEREPQEMIEAVDQRGQEIGVDPSNLKVVKKVT